MPYPFDVNAEVRRIVGQMPGAFTSCDVARAMEGAGRGLAPWHRSPYVLAELRRMERAGVVSRAPRVGRKPYVWSCTQPPTAQPPAG